MTLRSPAGRDSRADEARQKIRKVGELIRLAAKFKAERSGTNTKDDAVLERLDKAAGELDAGKGAPLERVREKIRGRADSARE
jgi:hypothetical protein